MAEAQCSITEKHSLNVNETFFLSPWTGLLIACLYSWDQKATFALVRPICIPIDILLYPGQKSLQQLSS